MGRTENVNDPAAPGKLAGNSCFVFIVIVQLDKIFHQRGHGQFHPALQLDAGFPDLSGFLGGTQQRVDTADEQFAVSGKQGIQCPRPAVFPAGKKQFASAAFRHDNTLEIQLKNTADRLDIRRQQIARTGIRQDRRNRNFAAKNLPQKRHCQSVKGTADPGKSARRTVKYIIFQKFLPFF